MNAGFRELPECPAFKEVRHKNGSAFSYLLICWLAEQQAEESGLAQHHGMHLAGLAVSLCSHGRAFWRAAKSQHVLAMLGIPAGCGGTQ